MNDRMELVPGGIHPGQCEYLIIDSGGSSNVGFVFERAGIITMVSNASTEGYHVLQVYSQVLTDHYGSERWAAIGDAMQSNRQTGNRLIVVPGKTRIWFQVAGVVFIVACFVD